MVSFVLLLIIVLTLPMVQATDFEDSFSGIGIWPKNNVDIDGHIDMLVPISDFKDQINVDINSKFIDAYPNYQTFDYLTNTEWISYWAYVDGATCSIDRHYDFFLFADSSEELKSLDEVKFIYVDIEGNTIVESEAFKVPNTFLFLEFNRLQHFDVANQEFDIDMALSIDRVFIFVLFAVLLVSFIFTCYRLLIAHLFKLNYKKNSRKGLYYFLTHILLMVVGYSIIYFIDFIQVLLDNYFSLMLYLAILFIIEVMASYFLFYKYLNKTRYFLASLVSYGSLYLLLLLLLLKF